MKTIEKLISEMNKIKTSDYFDADCDDIIENYNISEISKKQFDLFFDGGVRGRIY